MYIKQICTTCALFWTGAEGKEFKKAGWSTIEN